MVIVTFSQYLESSRNTLASCCHLHTTEEGTIQKKVERIQKALFYQILHTRSEDFRDILLSTDRDGVSVDRVQCEQCKIE